MRKTVSKLVSARIKTRGGGRERGFNQCWTDCFPPLCQGIYGMYGRHDFLRFFVMERIEDGGHKRWANKMSPPPPKFCLS